MKPNNSNYEDWLNELTEVALRDGIDLHLDKYHYHTFFMRGWLAESIVQDIKEREQ